MKSSYLMYTTKYEFINYSGRWDTRYIDFKETPYDKGYCFQGNTFLDDTYTLCVDLRVMGGMGNKPVGDYHELLLSPRHNVSKPLPFTVRREL